MFFLNVCFAWLIGSERCIAKWTEIDTWRWRGWLDSLFIVIFFSLLIFIGRTSSQSQSSSNSWCPLSWAVFFDVIFNGIIVDRGWAWSPVFISWQVLPFIFLFVHSIVVVTSLSCFAWCRWWCCVCAFKLFVGRSIVSVSSWVTLFSSLLTTTGLMMIGVVKLIHGSSSSWSRRWRSCWRWINDRSRGWYISCCSRCLSVVIFIFITNVTLLTERTFKHFQRASLLFFVLLFCFEINFWFWLPWVLIGFSCRAAGSTQQRSTLTQFEPSYISQEILMLFLVACSSWNESKGITGDER